MYAAGTRALHAVAGAAGPTPPGAVRWLSRSSARLSGASAAEARVGDDDLGGSSSSGPVGRGRLFRHRSAARAGGSNSGLPPVALPAWFLQDRVRLHQQRRHPPAPAAGPYRADLERVRALLFEPPGGAPVHRRRPDDDGADDSTDNTPAADQALLEQYFGDWLRRTAWTDARVAEARRHLARRGYGSGLDDAMDGVLARAGAAVAVAATYLVATIASRGGLPVEATDDSTASSADDNASATGTDVETTAAAAPPPPPPPLLPPDRLAQLDPYGTLDLPRRLADPAARAAVLDLMQPANRAARRVVQARATTLAALDTAAEASGRSALAARDAQPAAVLGELCATVRAELRAPGPAAAAASAAAARDARRPVTVLALVNHRGHSKAMALVDRVAARLAADVVHVDARALAAVVAPYLGQSLHAGRGNLALLGYAAAHISGQMAPRYGRHTARSRDEEEEEEGEEDDEDDEDDDHVAKDIKVQDTAGNTLFKVQKADGVMVFNMTDDGAKEEEDDDADEAEEDDDDDNAGGSRLAGSSWMLPRFALRPDPAEPADVLQPYPAEMDDRWDELKINRAVDALVRAADTKARALSASPSSAPLLLHVHNFLELSSVPEGARLLAKLRAAVDRRWQAGRPAVLVGSSAAHLHAHHHHHHALARKAEQLRQEDDCHVVPYRVDPGRAARALERHDCLAANLANVADMVAALTAGQASSSLLDEAWMQRLLAGEDDGPASVRNALSRHVLDIHWVYRFATLLVGGRDDTGAALPLGAAAFAQTLDAMAAQDRQWRRLAGAKKPYFSPLPTIRAHHKAQAKRQKNEEEELDEDDEDGNPGGRPVSPRTPPVEYTDDEKKFLSGLIDGHALRTTFDDIVLPQETKDALRALTSLSLERPDAFQYGVLATERIPGCLLYGPPGTGKTLLAKAVAKQSGAGMLEVSAASINDMWVGSSERNVQALFALARKLAPVVLFIDEADALLGARASRGAGGGGGGGGGARRETINQFLREWDGVSGSGSGGSGSGSGSGSGGSGGNNPNAVFVMVATNRPFDLDDAVLRRLPRRILVDLPLADARLAILRRLLRDECLDPAAAAALPRLAAADTELYSGSDLKNLCVAAAMEAVRDEVRAQAAHTGPAPFAFPPRRVLRVDHFERALQAIGASVSEDMPSLRAIRRFDERYGDNTLAGVDSDGKPRRRRRKKRTMGFEVAAPGVVTEDALVRQPA